MAKKDSPPPNLQDRPFPLQVVRTENHPSHACHKHPFWEIVLVTAGSGIHHVGQASHSLQAGDVFVLREKDAHRYSETRDLCVINILFDYAALAMDQSESRSVPGFQALFHVAPPQDPSPDSWPRLHLDSIRMGQTMALIDEIDRGMWEQLPCWRTIVKGHFRHLVVLLARGYDAHLRPHNDAPQRVAKAVAYFKDHFRQSIDLDRLIGQLGMSRRSFFRLFKQATGEAPLSYLIQLRLRHACTLLRNTDQSITQIGFDSGFSDSNYFTREFRKIIGETPRAYRKRWSD